MGSWAALPARGSGPTSVSRVTPKASRTLFSIPVLWRKTIDDIYRYPLRQSAVDVLNRQLRSGVSNEALAELAIALRDEDRLCVIHEEDERQEPRIICSMGLIAHGEQ